MPGCRRRCGSLEDDGDDSPLVGLVSTARPLTGVHNDHLSQSEREAVAGTVALARHAYGPQATVPTRAGAAACPGRLAWLLLNSAYRDLRRAPWVHKFSVQIFQHNRYYACPLIP